MNKKVLKTVYCFMLALIIKNKNFHVVNCDQGLVNWDFPSMTKFPCDSLYLENYIYIYYF